MDYRTNSTHSPREFPELEHAVHDVGRLRRLPQLLRRRDDDDGPSVAPGLQGRGKAALEGVHHVVDAVAGQGVWGKGQQLGEEAFVDQPGDKRDY